MTTRARREQTKSVAAIWAVIGFATFSLPAAAQEVAGSGMGQGQANINVRSDVTLAIKGLRSTTTERLGKLTEVVSDQLPALRKCYRELIAKRPTTVGSLSIRITLEQGASAPVLELKENGGADPDLTGCVKRVLEHAPLRKLERPAAAEVTLQFENTRAKGQQEMSARREVADKVDVREQAGGGYEAGWATADGKVGFTVSSATSRDAVQAVLRTLRASFAGFADCRRRADKDGLSPGGELALHLQLQRGAKASGKVASSSVAHPRAKPCVEHVLHGIHFEGAPSGEQLDVRVTFGP
jgi:hypothetical protein